MPGWMRRMFRRQKKGIRTAKRADNRGVSFVEVIVSMLIMAIAVIPLLGSFMMSLRVNLKSRQAMAATIVAQNVMECVKEYAHDKVVSSNVGEDMKEYLPGTYRDGFLSSGDGFELNNIREGVNNYSVKVRYDSGAFSTTDNTGLNDREIPDLTTLDAESTVVVCPAGVVNGSLESAAMSFFFDHWVSGQWVANAEVEGYSGPNEEERAKARSDISAYMTSELTIEVSGTKTSPKVEVLLCYMYDGASYSAYSVENSTGVSELENIYIFYDPLRVAGDPSGGYRIEDKVQIKNTGGFAWNLFFAVQESDVCLGGGYDTGKLSGPVFAMDWLYTGSPVGLYCSTKLEDDQRLAVGEGINQPGNLKLVDQHSLVETSSDRGRMRKVTVEVYRQGTNELLATMETDIMQ